MKTIDELNKWNKRAIIFTLDILMTVIAWLGAERLSGNLIFQKLGWLILIKIILIQCVFYFLCGLYRGVWRFASIPDLARIVKSVFFAVITIAIFSLVQKINLPIEICVIYTLLLTFLLSFPRILYRWLHDYRQFFTHGKKVLVVGAGNAGDGIIRDLRRFPLNKKFKPVAFVDDDATRLGSEVQGVRVLGSCKDIPKLVAKLEIELILIAIPSAGSKRMREIVSYCERSKVAFRTLPGIKDIADGTVSINSLREVLLEDLLGREQVNLDWGNIKQEIADKIIMVTGGGGSIGSELCRQISNLSPQKLIIIDNNEFNLYSIDLELRNKFNNILIQTHLCSVTDRVEMENIFKLYQPSLVFHVAAYKHVPLLESHIRVAMVNNFIGTRYVAELASEYQVKTFVLISTDKAVNPGNIMGATKRASEVFCQNFNFHSKTKFLTVRFGNVLDSAGSVIPLFRKQLLAGGPLTVTHQAVSRYFMTIPEASQLILQAATMDQSGGIFVLDMGQPIKIRYLAEQMIKLSGKIVGKDIDIKYIGLRSGEKLHEELFHSAEDISKTAHAKINQAKVRSFDWSMLLKIISEVDIACEKNDEAKLKKLLSELVPEYQTTKNNLQINPDANLKVFEKESVVYS